MQQKGCFQVFGKILLMPAAALVSEAKKNYVCKPSELPIYTPDSKGLTLVKKQEVEEKPNAVEEAFASIRQTITKLHCEFLAYKRVGEDYASAALEQIVWLKDYLAEEENTSTKYGAIAIGGLTGYILALRGRFFKKTLYTSIGALGMAAVCYPKEASHYTEMGINEAKKYITIAYNFIYGVKKDDPPLELPSLPKLPSSISEAWEIASGIGKSASSIVTGQMPQSNQKSQVNETEILDPLTVVTQAHTEASQNQCHCPIGACLGHGNENPNKPG